MTNDPTVAEALHSICDQILGITNILKQQEKRIKRLEENGTNK